jgi:drug/metabolite transporter (DMT)-like permease
MNLPLAACVTGLVLYQLSQKFWPRSIHPLRGLALAYLVAALATLLASHAVNAPDEQPAPGPLPQLLSLWPVLALGLSTVAVEASYIALYRRGAALSRLGPYSGAAATAALVAIGALLLRERLDARGWAGLAACLLGSLLLAGR